MKMAINGDVEYKIFFKSGYNAAIKIKDEDEDFILVENSKGRRSLIAKSEIKYVRQVIKRVV